MEEQDEIIRKYLDAKRKALGNESADSTIIHKKGNMYIIEVRCSKREVMQMTRDLERLADEQANFRTFK